MIIQILVKGGGSVLKEEYPAYDCKAVPSVGDSIHAEHLDRLSDALQFPDDDESWKVDELQWYFGDSADDMGCDVLLWATHKHLRQSLDDWFKAMQSQ